MKMRKNIILVFFLLLGLQITQILVASRSIHQLQTAVDRVTLTIIGRETSRSTHTLLNQFRDNLVLVAGMNHPVSGLEKLNVYWTQFMQRFTAMSLLGNQLFADSKLLAQLHTDIRTASREKELFEQTIMDKASGENYKQLVRDAAFNFDESLENVRESLEVAIANVAEEEKLAVAQEKAIHDLPIQAVTTIGFVLGLILIALGVFSVAGIVNPLINLTIQYRITAERLKKEREISLALEKAQAAAKAKSDFLANMSHELRTPMNTILGFSELLNRTDLNEQQKNYIALIISSSQHLVELINDVLDFSKFEAGKITLENIDFDLRTIINEVMNMIKIKTIEKAIEISIDYPTEVISNIKSDPTKFKQVLINLANNAAKFTKEGEIGIIVREEKQIDCAENEVPLSITVKDTGIGIPRNKIHDIFNEFTQADESTTRQYGGTGLGLSISKSIVEAMGGRIWAESQEGKGSRFIFTLKVKKGNPVERSRIDPEARKMLVGRKVFVVEDNPTSRKIIEEICRSAGLKVLASAESGPRALTILEDAAKKNDLPDIILSDVMMANMDGYKLAQTIRANKAFSRIHIIAVTAKELGISRYIKDDCFEAYLEKPVTELELIRSMSCALGYKPKPEAHTLTTEVADSYFEGLKILVVEDTLLNQKLLQSIFQRMKCQIDIANNGKEAIQKLEAREYDLCLMDLQMPVMDGIEAAKIIRERISKDLPIIALTAAVLTEDRTAAKQAGMNDFLEKPINIPEFKRKIQQYTQQKKV